MLRDEAGRPVSRAGKPLHNLQNIPAHITDAEIFLGNWEETVSAVRTHGGEPVSADAAYSLDPLDERLIIDEVEDPAEETILQLLATVVNQGHEGLVLRQGDRWFKVKPAETFDVRVTGFIEGKGKHAGRLGLFTTDMGNVGTGFTDFQREQYWDIRDELVGAIIEVECMSLTPAGKFRHPRFVRFRWDKNEVNKEAT